MKLTLTKTSLTINEEGKDYSVDFTNPLTKVSPVELEVDALDSSALSLLYAALIDCKVTADLHHSPMPFLHHKTGNVYWIQSISINCNNDCKFPYSVHYSTVKVPKQNSPKFIRDYDEFSKKFSFHPESLIDPIEAYGRKNFIPALKEPLRRIFYITAQAISYAVETGQSADHKELILKAKNLAELITKFSKKAKWPSSNTYELLKYHLRHEPIQMMDDWDLEEVLATGKILGEVDRPLQSACLKILSQTLGVESKKEVCKQIYFYLSDL